MKAGNSLSLLQTRLLHVFRDAGILEQALTHSSLGSPARPHNQRMEFLGDRVLGLVIADALQHADQTAPEGKLAQRFNALVRKETCAEVAATIGLGDFLILGRSESATGGRKKMALLGDAMEAVIAALYLDGGYEVARKSVLALWGDRIGRAESLAQDPKSALQEWAQARGLERPDYVDLSRSGSDHAPVFRVAVRLANGASAEGEAASKKLAQQQAASLLLARLEA